MTTSIPLTLTTLCLTLSGFTSVHADDNLKVDRAALLQQVWSHLENGDSAQATDYVESRGAPLLVAAVYSNLVRDLYGAKHDVPRMIIIGRAGCAFCLAQSQAAAKSGDEKLALSLKSFAKEIAYNVSANCWPGWEDKGIVITLTDQRIGLDLAKLNLRLGRELKRGDDKISAAHWLVGAHLLGLGQHSAAIEQFEQSAKLDNSGERRDAEQMALGYIAIAKLASNPENEAAKRQLDEAVTVLKQLGTEDAKFFASQLVSVNKFFAKLTAASKESGQ
ncbi:MAG: hypothetical protein KDB14_34125 [Planctomycetales bacterium]|nr:hypothetical protein [Planctomycetales bacterium]